MGEKLSPSMGRRMRKRRRELGLTQKALADIVGVSMAAVSLWEKEGAEPSARNPDAIANALNCDSNWLLKGPRDNENSNPTVVSINGKTQVRSDDTTVQQINNLLEVLPESCRKEILEYTKKKLNEHIEKLTQIRFDL